MSILTIYLFLGYLVIAASIGAMLNDISKQSKQEDLSGFATIVILVILAFLWPVLIIILLKRWDSITGKVAKRNKIEKDLEHLNGGAEDERAD